MTKNELRQILKDLTIDKFIMNFSKVQYKQQIILDCFQANDLRDIERMSDYNFSHGKLQLLKLLDDKRYESDYNLLEDLSFLVENRR